MKFLNLNFKYIRTVYSYFNDIAAALNLTINIGCCFYFCFEAI